MITSWVQVNGPANRDVFVGYNFTVPAGRTNTPFRIRLGGNTFILLTPNLIIEARTRAYVIAAEEIAPVIIDLWPPPQPSQPSQPSTTTAASGPRP